MMKRHLWLKVIVSIALCLPLAAHAKPSSPPTLSGCPVYPADNIWNVPVDTLPLDAHSAAYVNTIGSTQHVHADFGSGTWEGFPIGIPYTTVPGTQAKVLVDFTWPGESDAGPYPIPPDAPTETQVILRALKKYGMILADNGSSWYLSGAPDERWNNEKLHALDTWVKGSDFEAVEVSSLMVDPDSGQALSDFTLAAQPASRAIHPGSVVSYQLILAKSAAFTGAVTVTTSSPSPSLTLKLSQASVTPPITITLTVTDTHTPGSLPIWYSIPITATGGSVTRFASVGLLVNGTRTYLPMMLKD
jgi:hypothetical protein